MAEGRFINKYCPIILLLIASVFITNYAQAQSSTAENGSNAQALHSIGITGAGINVGLLSARNVRYSHKAFCISDTDSNSRVHNYDFSGMGIDYMTGSPAGHDTWVAGIVASRGWPGFSDAIGAAPGCNIYSGRILIDTTGYYLEKGLDDFTNKYNCKVFLIPLMLTDDANGNTIYSKILDYYAYNKNIIFALAPGNTGYGPTRIAVFGDAYNGITTGALIDEPNTIYSRVGASSLPGPTIDGRKKPDIVAPGSSQITPSISDDLSYYPTIKDGATSFSIPQTAGIAALLLQYAKSTTDTDDEKNIVIKAAIVNSTMPNIRDKSGSFTDPANRVWDPNRGYGRIDALKAYQTLSAGRIIKDMLSTSAKGWAYDTMNQGETHSYFITGKKNQRLLVTVTWNRAIAKTWSNKNRSYDYNEPLPLFKMDMFINKADDENIFYLEGNNNNLEKADFILPVDGNYAVVLSNTTNEPGKSRDYALAFELLDPLTGDFCQDYIVNNKDLSQLALDWLNTSSGLATDIIPDNHVNILDFGEFAENWMRIDRRYYTP